MPENPWDQLDNESTAAFAAFRIYRDMGPERTLDKAYLKHYENRGGKPGGLQRVSGRWRLWCTEHAWVDRARAWDNRDQRIEREARDAVVRQDATARTLEQVRSDRRRQQEEDEWSLRCKLLETAQAMLAEVMDPLVTHKPLFYKGELIRHGGKPIIITTKKKIWNASSLAKIADVATKLGRLSAQMPHTTEDYEPPPPDMKDVLFATSGQFASAMPAGAVPTMPEDVMAKPVIDAGRGGSGRGGELKQPAIERPEP